MNEAKLKANEGASPMLGNVIANQRSLSPERSEEELKQLRSVLDKLREQLEAELSEHNAILSLGGSYRYE